MMKGVKKEKLEANLQR